MLSVGIPCEIKSGEKRVGLTPAGVGKLTQAGIPVWVEKAAGEKSGFPDSLYKKQGAQIVDEAAELYARAGIIQKVKEPLRSEWIHLREDLILFCYLHLASPANRELVDVLIAKKAIGIGFETVEKEGRTIFLEPMSAIAGTLAGYFAGFFGQEVRVEENEIIYADHFREKLEALASQYPRIPKELTPGRAIVFGGGTVGEKAAGTLLAMGGEVCIVEKRAQRRETLGKIFKSYGSRLRLWDSEKSYAEILRESEIWIGCVHRVGERAPQVTSESQLKEISKGRKKLILDIAVDQGGNFPETRPTSYEDPLYLDSFGNLRFAVANVPSLCGRGASEALEKVTLDYVLQLAQDWKMALRKFPELKKGLQTYRGKLVNEAVARAHGLGYSPAQI